MSEDLLALPAPEPTATFRYGPGSSQVGDLFLPSGDGPHPLVVALHGGFWRARYDRVHLRHLAAFFASQGLAVASLEYRRSGEAGGGFPGTFDDVTAGLAQARRLDAWHPVVSRRPLLLGHSAGGHLALWLAARHRDVAGVVSLAGMADLVRVHDLHLSNDAVVEFLGTTPSIDASRYVDASPRHRLPFRMPQLVVHGDVDDCVPLELSRDYVEEARRRGDHVDTRFFAGGHYEPIDPRWVGQGDVVRWMRSVVDTPLRTG